MKTIIHRDNIGEVLQRIYDSEIHIALGWCWDGGVEYSLKGQAYPLEKKYEDIQHTCDTDIASGIGYLVSDILRDNPTSAFAKWANSVDLSIKLK